MRAEAASGLCRWWSRHAYILPSFFISILVCAWFATLGDWKFFEPEKLSGFYDAQARSILGGHLDVPPSAIGDEAFTVGGKTYGYFGIAPALLRLPLVLAFPSMDGRWSRLMVMAACTISLLCAYRIMRFTVGDEPVTSRVRQWLHSLFIVCAGIGSTNVFLVARSFVFHEAIIWSAAFGLLFALTVLKYLSKPSVGLLVAAGLFAFMSLHARATVGAGALLCLCLLSGVLAWRSLGKSFTPDGLLALGAVKKPGRHALLAGAVAVIIAVSYFGVNYAKFHTFDAVPLQYYDFYVQNPRNLEMTKGRQLHLENVPTAFATYFGIRGCWLDPRFPWVFPSREATFIGSPVIIVAEGFSTFPVSMPALFTIALLGCSPLFLGSDDRLRQLRLPVLTLFLGGATVLATVAITERYLHDFYPALILCGASGIHRIGSHRRARPVTIVLVFFSVISVALNCAFALENQRLDAWAMGGVPPAKRAAFKQLQASIYRFFHR